MDRTVETVIESVLNEQRQEMSRSLVLALQSQVGAASIWRNDTKVKLIRQGPVKANLNQNQKIRKTRDRTSAPSPSHPSIPLPAGFEVAPPVLALGHEQETAFCLVNRGRAIFPSHPQGLAADGSNGISNADDRQRHHKTVSQCRQLLGGMPAAIALDAHSAHPHPDLGQGIAATHRLSTYPVQSHHAQIAACMVAHHIPLDTPPVLGITLDRLGRGDDDTLWGGEFLLADYRGFRRLATFKPIALIGGDQAPHQPWRSTYAHLMASFDWDDVQSAYGELEILQFINDQPREMLNQMVLTGIHAPRASSCGQLIDAVAAAVGLCRDRTAYEGQAAQELAALVDDASLAIAQDSPYGFTIQWLHRCTERQLPYIEPIPMWWQILEDLQQQMPISLISARFHVGLARAIADMTHHLSQDNPIDQVALTGSVFENRVLLALVRQFLSEMGLTVLSPSQEPFLDGSIALGQGAIAAAQTLKRRNSR
ncbi:MAG: hypothetical protein ACFB8W_09265 [Elainellaceae cyanobacterium]